ncbi:MAG: flagellar motor stator protein MotA [Nitrospinae bacterium]|nr:flagellar motor stator protein MotA [Nitrospinota bacterium]
MLVIVGGIIVLGCVLGGYAMEHGNFSVLLQPAELIIIGGAAVGGFIIQAPMKIIKMVFADLKKILASKTYAKADYLEALLLMSEIFFKIRREGLISIEEDVENPTKSKIFSKYPKFVGNHHALAFVTDTLRTVMSTSISHHDLDALLDAELEAHHEESLTPSKVIGNVADALPGLGIVAAVLGVVITMGKIDEPPSVLGHHVGAALVGTFLGVLLCYGYVGPISKALEALAGEDHQYLGVLKVILVAFVRGEAPQVAVEFGRRVIPGSQRPSFQEVEAALGKIKK